MQRSGGQFILVIVELYMVSFGSKNNLSHKLRAKYICCLYIQCSLYLPQYYIKLISSVSIDMISLLWFCTDLFCWHQALTRWINLLQKNVAAMHSFIMISCWLVLPKNWLDIFSYHVALHSRYLGYTEWVSLVSFLPQFVLLLNLAKCMKSITDGRMMLKVPNWWSWLNDHHHSSYLPLLGWSWLNKLLKWNWFFLSISILVIIIFLCCYDQQKLRVLINSIMRRAIHLRGLVYASWSFICGVSGKWSLRSDYLRGQKWTYRYIIRVKLYSNFL